MQNNVSLGDLAVFLAVLDEGGFRAAAKRLGVAPSKVSTTVSRVEVGLGLPLLLRTTRTVRATEAGRALADRIAPLLAEVNAACVETASTTNRVQGRLKLNVPGAVVPDILPPILAEFQRRYPLVNVEIVVENTLVDIIAAGTYDQATDLVAANVLAGTKVDSHLLHSDVPTGGNIGTPACVVSRYSQTTQES